ncbi:Lar family restriction alleviation protein [Novosphingobium sp. B1]|uniref:Lar family restriction alleviation protein n=1 Tax=Novosphingobium sp. B1 TaxID=1938756 RepID=UPI0009D8CCCB|nr:Lar family restriction alleviation protein [Novosphingobium sp. B1]SMD03798.1 Restriction alleviation protein Lar [Novosphingobium sp. B1]
MTQPLQTDSLEACPFCCSEAKIIAPLGFGNVRAVDCRNDQCSATGPWARNEAEAIKAWNTRAAPQSQAALVDALRANISVMEGALQQIAGSHWERFGVDQTDIEELPDLSADEAMNLARAVLMDTATPPEPRETEL